MEKYIQVVKEIISREFEEEWLEFKENWFDAHGIGEYISSLSKLKLNYLVIHQRKYELFFILLIYQMIKVLEKILKNDER